MDYLIEEFKKIKSEDIQAEYKKYLSDYNIYKDCKDGSGSQVAWNLAKFKEYFRGEFRE